MGAGGEGDQKLTTCPVHGGRVGLRPRDGKKVNHLEVESPGRGIFAGRTEFGIRSPANNRGKKGWKDGGKKLYSLGGKSGDVIKKLADRGKV